MWWQKALSHLISCRFSTRFVVSQGKDSFFLQPSVNQMRQTFCTSTGLIQCADAGEVEPDFLEEGDQMARSFSRGTSVNGVQICKKKVQGLNWEVVAGQSKTSTL